MCKQKRRAGAWRAGLSAQFAHPIEFELFTYHEPPQNLWPTLFFQVGNGRLGF
jgi:hypothetical protein